MVVRIPGVDSVTKEFNSTAVIAALMASDAETIAGVLTTKAVRPAGLKAATPFSVVFPSGDATGVTDRANLLAAAAFRSHIRLGPGTFYVNSAITLGSNQHWQGTRDLTTVFLVSGSNTWTFDYASGGLTNVTIEDLTVDGNKAGNTLGHGGIRFPVFSNSTLRRCRIKNTTGMGFQSSLGTNVTVVDNEFVDIGSANTDSSLNSAIVSTTVGAIVTGNRVDGCSDTAIGVFGDGSNLVANNVVDDCYFIGIGLGAGHTVAGGPHVIVGNSIKGALGNSIDTGTACNVTVSGNTCMGGYTGIDIDISSVARSLCNIAIVGNTIRDMAACGIELLGNQTNAHTGFSIVGNTITHVGQHGIHLVAMQDGAVQGNQLTDVSYTLTGYAFIRLNPGTGNPGCDDVQIIGNRMNNETATNSYALHLDANSDRLTVIGNDMDGTWAKIVGAISATSIVRGNIGYKTEGGGVASVANAGTINHGLVVAPTRASLTPTVAGRQVAVTAIGATTLTVSLTDSAGAAIAVAENVYWTAEV